MGYRRAIRTLISTSRGIDRNSRSLQRLLDKKQALYDKMKEIEQNEEAAQCFDDYVEKIQNLHKECKSYYNWNQIKNSREPSKPIDAAKNTNIALQYIELYKPSLMDKLLKRVEKKTAQLNADLEAARKKDAEIYKKAIKEYNEKVEEHKERVALATSILEKDIEAYKIAIEELSPLEELTELGVSVQYPEVTQTKVKVIILHSNDDIIPKQQISLLKSGKLSIKDMTISKRNELYQDYICSAALRVARELFSLLPIDTVLLNVKSYMLNTVTGEMDFQTVLSVQFLRKTMEEINFDRIDPSDSMRNFIHNMNYKKTQGMLPVEELQ